jgi:hypothetical protein
MSTSDRLGGEAGAPCYFLDKLSPELRNRIYEYVLIERNSEEERSAIDITKETQPGLLRTCRQCREEGSGMYYHFNWFGFTTTTKDEDAL